MAEDHLEILREAKKRAERLVGELEAQRKEILANPPKLSADDLRQGADAMQNAIAAARRTLAALEAAADEKNS